MCIRDRYYTAQANITKFMNWANHLEFIEKNEQITELLNSAYAALNTNLDLSLIHI